MTPEETRELKALRERDEARAEVEKWKFAWKRSEEDRSIFCRERDEARNLARALLSVSHPDLVNEKLVKEKFPWLKEVSP